MSLQLLLLIMMISLSICTLFVNSKTMKTFMSNQKKTCSSKALLSAFHLNRELTKSLLTSSKLQCKKITITITIVSYKVVYSRVKLRNHCLSNRHYLAKTSNNNRTLPTCNKRRQLHHKELCMKQRMSWNVG
jgi:hypothetical protein